ncbi:MAG TPA: HAMP domain-containing sensor histidine kinase [Gaiellales bacterium]|nr:HAMP domain-containing sensor histidine kinase [Gaiellales bacterium]
MKDVTSRFLPELALALFCTLNLVWIALWHGWEALPVHFIFVSVSIVYGLRMWTALSSVLALSAVVVPIFLLTLRAIQIGSESQAELAEIPLMSLIFLVMVWHVRERQLVVERGRALFDNASHELLTPLTIARGELELLGRDGHVPSMQEILETRQVVLEELQRSEVLASGLLALSRLDAAHTPVRTMVSTDDLLDAAAERWRRVADRQLVIASRVGGEVPCARQDIERLLDNLIENALRHTPTGSSVMLAAHARGRRLVLEVTDHGGGIPSDALPYIFDRFYRARSSDGTRGSGLGLAIVKAIAESHEGSVDAKTSPGVGTTFRVELPGFERETGEQLPLPLVA